MRALSSCPPMMRSLEAGVCPPPLYKWRLQVHACSLSICLTFADQRHVWLLHSLIHSFTVTVFTESHPSDVSEAASQSVPMVSTSTGGMTAPGEAVPGDDGDDVFVAEAESEGWAVFHDRRYFCYCSNMELWIWTHPWYPSVLREWFTEMSLKSLNNWIVIIQGE